jgi:2'-hydroxyisoflavone reductase
MRILVMGGTRFIGRHLVTALQAGGHDVTLVNRGRTAPDVWADVPQLHVDRQSVDLGPVLRAAGDWDAVMDLSCYHPADAESLLQAVDGRIGRYVYLSTISVYDALSGDDLPQVPLAEDSPLSPWTESCAAAPAEAPYGARKAEGERIVHRWQDRGLATAILRPSVVYGAHDYTDRLAYWIWRAMSGRPFLLPDGGRTVFMRTYAPDLAQALVAAVTTDRLLGGIWNVVESLPLTWARTLHLLGEALGTDPLLQAVSVATERFASLGLDADSEIPLYAPQGLRFDTAAFWALGLFPETPVAQALSEAAVAFQLEGRPPVAGMSDERETALLAALVP